MTAEILEGEVVSREVVPFETALPVNVDAALAEWNDYQRLTRELLDESDFQQIGNRKFKKKSAWRKYARAFNITDRVTAEEISRSDNGFPIYARIRVEAKAPSGRTAEADQECHVTERCCQQPCPKKSWRSHECCAEDCDGRKHWSHPGDLPATALTRAKNRAISDLIGAGEVSAEEMESEPKTAEDVRDARFEAGFKKKPLAEQGEQIVQQRQRGPKCPVHGPLTYRPGGVSPKTGNTYSAFWGCIKSCAAGEDGKSFYVRDAAWAREQEIERTKAASA